MLNRHLAPQIHDIQNIFFPPIDSGEIGENIAVHSLREMDIGTFKLEVMTKGGHWASKNASLCHLSNRMLNEGTKIRQGNVLAQEVDALGSFLEITPGFDHSSISIYGLSKFFDQNVELISDILYNSIFDQTALDKLKSKQINKLRLNREKGSYLSSINLRKSLFGDNHPYGFTLIEDDIEAITIEDIKDFHRQSILDFELFVSGQLPQDFEQSLSRHFFDRTVSNPATDLATVDDRPQDIEYRNQKFIQSSIKIGKRLVNRNHPDYIPFMVTNEVLGGFFGSRLMRNIREEKGYTYGIYSSLYSLLNDAYFQIGTDVKGENESDTIREILKEIEVLQNERVGEEELETVKNYMVGTFVNSFTSPFANIEKFKVLKSQGIKLDFYEDYIDTIRAVTSESIQSMAQNYLSTDTLVKSIAGS